MPEYLAVYDTFFQSKRENPTSITGERSRELRTFEAENCEQAREMAEGEIKKNILDRHKRDLMVHTNLKLVWEGRIVLENLLEYERDDMRYVPEKTK
ncbi:hypothetical protein COU59_02725 [Candidatus Pacearchaeota archaeon CG10_big_fil_rev_8_21_14_0_10_34_12]|nr:MAG: hypothetical protein COU59_02725 [Candidatus Pacearchaeota archaeon CG10_big_fil_rev_8_21_14_0_10_34_12]